MRLGQNFLADRNLLGAIVREAAVEPDDVVLEVGGGEGALTAQIAPLAARVHVIELDQRLRPALEAVAADHPNVGLHFGDAMRLDLAALHPAPTRMVANLPYSIATPLLLRTIAELPGVRSWTLMVQREIADRLRAATRLTHLRRAERARPARLRGADPARRRPGRVHAAPAGRLGADRPAPDRPRRLAAGREAGSRRLRTPAQVAGALARARAAGLA